MKLKKPIGTMAVEVGEGAERVAVDTIAVVGLLINDKNAQVVFGFGGTDSNGHFHRDLKRLNDDAPLVIDRLNEQQRELFESLFCDASGNLSWDYGRGFMEKLCDTLLPAAYKLIWGTKYPDMEVSRNGKVIFKQEVPKQ
jgi:hypothetical protein